MSEDLRKHKRFNAWNGACATFARPEQPGLTKVGQIMDMSMGGIALKYVSEGEMNRLDERIYVEIFGISAPFITAGKIFCRVVYDIPLTNFSDSAVKLRRCGLEFQGLSQLQSYNIGHFIETFSRDQGRNIALRYGVLA